MRLLSALENFFWQRSKNDYHPGFIVSVLLNKPIPDDVLAEAIRLTGEDFPVLFQQIEETNSDSLPVIVPIRKTLVTEDVIRHVDDDECNHLFQNYKMKATDDQCSWVVFVKENRLSLMADHTLFDGMSSYNVLNSIIKYANKGVRSTNGLIYNANAPLLPPQHPYDELETNMMGNIKAKIAPFWIQYVSPLVSKVLPTQNFNFPEFDLQKHLYDEAGKLKQDNCYYSWNIPPKDLKTVLQSCRDHNVTLSVWICARVTEQLSKASDSTAGNLINIQIPMNMRPYLMGVLHKSSNSIAVGNYVSVSACTVDISKDELEQWSLAQNIQEQLEKSKSDPAAAIEYIKLLKQVNVAKFLKSKYAATIPETAFELSNLGVLDPSSANDEYQLLNAQFHQPKFVSSILCCSSISTRLGGLTVNISYPPTLDKVLRPLFEDL